MPIIALTPFPEVQRKLGLYWGVRLAARPEGRDHRRDGRGGRGHPAGDGTVDNDDVLVIISGAPMWVTGTTNLLEAPPRRRPALRAAGIGQARRVTGRDNGLRQMLVYEVKDGGRHPHAQPPRRLQCAEPPLGPGPLPRHAGGGRGPRRPLHRDHRRGEGLLRGRRRQGLRRQSGDRIGILIKELTTYLHGAVSRLARAAEAGDHGRQRRGRGRRDELRPRAAISSWRRSRRSSPWRISKIARLPRRLLLVLPAAPDRAAPRAGAALHEPRPHRPRGAGLGAREPRASGRGVRRRAGRARPRARRRGRRWPSAAPSSSSTSPRRRAWRPRWSSRRRPSPPAATPRTSRRA